MKKNIAIMNFGSDLNGKFQTVRGISKIPTDKKVLFISTGEIRVVPSNRLDIVSFEQGAPDKLTDDVLKLYSLVILDSEFTEAYDNVRLNTKEDIAFLFLVKTTEQSNHEMFVDIEGMKKMPLIQKTMELNRIRKKFKEINMIKKFKFFS